MTSTIAPTKAATRLSGAQALLESLQREGVDIVFGYPGGRSFRSTTRSMIPPIRHILVRHEQGAAHAADGYARSTGRSASASPPPAPAPQNLVTGIATAYMDSIPMVVITGQVTTGAIGKDSFQEADIPASPCPSPSTIIW